MLPEFVSVVMPTLNQAKFIEQAMNSVLDQSVRKLELVVADGGSTDGTLEILRKRAAADARIRWHSAKDSGPANAVNNAVARTRGTIIGWLNSDDMYAPGAIQRAVEVLMRDPQLMMVYGRGQHIDGEGRFLHLYPTLSPPTPAVQFKEGCFICQPTVFFRRTMTMLLGKLDEQLKCAFDFEYWLRAFKLLPERIGFVDALQASSRLHDGCITMRMRQRVALEGMEVLHRHLGLAPKEWLLTYANELMALPPADRGTEDLRTHFGDALAQVRTLMDPNEYAELEVEIRKLLQ